MIARSIPQEPSPPQLPTFPTRQPILLERPRLCWFLNPPARLPTLHSNPNRPHINTATQRPQRIRGLPRGIRKMARPSRHLHMMSLYSVIITLKYALKVKYIQGSRSAYRDVDAHTLLLIKMPSSKGSGIKEGKKHTSKFIILGLRRFT